MDLLNLFDYEKAAASIMPRPYHAYYAGGVADNLTLRDNRAAFDRLRLRPRILRDVSHADPACFIAGRPSAMPVMLAPTAMHKLAHPEGEVAMARAAKNHRIIQVLSTLSTCPVEAVTAVGHEVWFQLYLFRNRTISEHIIGRAEAAGCKALVLTVDVPVAGLRENLVRAGFATPKELPFPNLTLPDSPDLHADLMATLRTNFDPGLTWNDIEWIRSRSSLPLWIKGVLRADDAQRAVEAGVAGIIVSNHGGRQLDTAVAAIDALPEIAAAVGDRVGLLLDGGICRGTDVLKALALGAHAVLLGRAPLWGLAVAGEAGVGNVLQILRDELINVMQQCGSATIAKITADLIFHPQAAGRINGED